MNDLTTVGPSHSEPTTPPSRSPKERTTPTSKGFEQPKDGVGAGGKNAVRAGGHGDDADDELLEAMWPHFVARTTNGSVDLAQLELICEEIGVECDAEMLRRVVKGERQEGLFFQEAIDAIHLALRSSKDDLFDDGEDELDQATVHMSPPQYLLYSMGCGVYDPTKEYVLDWSLCFSARNVLVLSTMVVFFLVAAALIAFTSVTWMNGALDREREMIVNFKNALHLFVTALESRLLEAHADSILDTSNTVARWTEFMWWREQDAAIATVRRQHGLVSALVADSFTQLEAEVQAMVTNLSAIARALSFAASEVNTVEVLLPLLQGWLARGAGAAWDVGLNRSLESSTAAAGGNTVVVVRPFADTAHAVHCHYSAAPFEVARSDPLGDGSVVAVAVAIPTALAHICMVLDRATLVDFALPRAVELLNELRRLPDHPRLSSTATPMSDLWRISHVRDGEAFHMSESRTIEGFRHLFADRITPLTEHGQLLMRRARNALGHYPLEFVDSLARILETRNVSTTCGTAILAPREKYWWCASFIPHLEAVQTTALPQEIVLSDFQVRLRDTVESMNWEFERTTEIVLGGREPGTDAFIPQATSFRFAHDCFGECERFLESSLTAYASIQTQSGGWMLAPDYRPQPVLSTFAFMDDELAMPVIIERDVRDLRSSALQSMVEIVNQVNRNSRANQEVQLVRYPELPTMPFFDVMEACPIDVFCYTRPGNHTGVLSRRDCVDCERATALTPNAPIEILTELRYPERCNGECRVQLDRRQPSLARSAVDSEEMSTTDTDYTGERVLAASGYLEKLSTALLVKVYEDSVIAPVVISIIISAIAAGALSLVGLSVVTWSTTRVLRRIEEEWHANKRQLEAERIRFIRYTDFLVPRHVIRKVRSGHSMVAEASTSANVIAMDICGFSDVSKGWPHGQLIRFITYVHYLMDESLSLYGIFKLKSFGDCVVGVSGFGKHHVDQFSRGADDSSSHSGSHSHNGSTLMSSKYMTASGSSGMTDASLKQVHAQVLPVENCMDCALVLVQLFGPAYCHIPTFRGKSGGSGSNRHRTMEGICNSVPLDMQATREAAKNALQMPAIRVGIARGPLVSGYINVGKTPRFDCYGQTMLAAMRMQLTSQPNRVHVSNSFREEYLAARQGKLEVVTFEPPRKTIVKGRTTIVSFLVKDADVHPAEQFTARLGLLHSHHRFGFKIYDETGKQISESGTSSVLSRSTARSSRSSRSKKSSDSK